MARIAAASAGVTIGGVKMRRRYPAMKIIGGVAAAHRASAWQRALALGTQPRA